MRDNIFFEKTQLVVGKKLVYQGVSDPDSEWNITEIKTETKKKMKNTNQAQKLNDQVLLKKLGTNETKRMSVCYLSYSSIWRLLD